MEVSNKSEGVSEDELRGSHLIDQLVSLTGLPEAWVSQELVQVIKKSGKNENEVSLEELRDAILIYLEETFSADLIQETE